MEVVALVFSLLATGVAGLAAWYTRRQAQATDELQRIEAQRHHEERSPVLVADFDVVDETSWVRFQNRGPIDLTEVTWDLKVDLSRHPLAGLGGPDSQRGQTGPMPIGASALVSAELVRSAPAAGTATIVARCEAGAERCTLPLQVDVQRRDPPRVRFI